MLSIKLAYIIRPKLYFCYVQISIKNIQTKCVGLCCGYILKIILNYVFRNIYIFIKENEKKKKNLNRKYDYS